MSSSIVKIGLDLRDDLIYAARVKNGVARPEIKALIRLKREFPLEHRLLENGDIVIGISDELAMIKHIYVPQDAQYNKNELGKFEMIQSLLEDESNFQFETINTAYDNDILGYIVRKNSLENISESFNSDLLKNKKLKYCLRSLALANGYIAFCHRDAGDLICLADISNSIISICFIYKSQPIELTYLDINNLDQEKDDFPDKFALEFKTIINFKLASIFEKGITLPLSTLNITGEKADQNLIIAMQKYFNIEIAQPKINSGFFTDPSQINKIPIHNYLISLGLSVE